MNKVVDWAPYHPFFTVGEFRCKCGCGRAAMDIEFMDGLLALRKEYNRPMIISSGFRCPTHNTAVSTTGPHGPHTTGQAADIRVYGEWAYQLARLAFNMGFTGIGFHQKSAHAGRFLHLDCLTPPHAVRPTIWSY